ncbi:uncharacterized protein BX664DRAFT_1351 [Halteromyces radiatus]|uniref:uncharacterized protein n=1 Tax=Halteromyces radiatus TaxID=101107 RepID=UPI00221EF6A6|nr:uncharacterized protein BX664DRAFT_1351 [Halteromyces radiatus]KAI8098507.1 hypothetical protein BX664DRAFT_1351 [Halteromyces radiatus]
MLDKNTWSTCSDFGTRFRSCKDDTDLMSTLIHRQQLEQVFCNDFICCNQYWTDLHSLLQHCEDCHANRDIMMMMNNYDDRTTLYDVPEHDDDDDDDDEDEDDDDELLTPLSPVVSDSPLLSQHLTNLSALENSQHQSSLMRPCETQEEYGYEKIKEWMQQAQSLPGVEEQEDESHRPYRCRVPGCDKAYKNANGLKYHKAHGHDKQNENIEETLQKPYLCSLGRCRKRYKNLNGLKYHIQHGHFKHRRPSFSSSSSPVPSMFPSIPFPVL